MMCHINDGFLSREHKHLRTSDNSTNETMVKSKSQVGQYGQQKIFFIKV